MNSIVINILKALPDKYYIQLQYFKNFGRFVNFKNPRTFNEKLQWLKIHDRRPEYTMMVDKFLVKNYVAGLIGDEFIIPTIEVYDSVNDIDFNVLPKRFVLKWNHDSGSIVICNNKETFDQKEAIKNYLVQSQVCKVSGMDESGHIKMLCLN